MTERVLIVKAPAEIKDPLKTSMKELMPRLECVFVESVGDALSGARLVLSFDTDSADFLTLCREADLFEVGVIQVRFQSFNLDNDEHDDVWESPIMDQSARVMLLDFPMLAVRLFPNVLKEINNAGQRELDDSSFFNIVTVPDVARVVSSVVAQSLSGSQNWGRFFYATGGKVTWHRLVAYLCDDTHQSDVNAIVAGAGLGIDRSLDGEALKFAFGIKPRPWRVGLLDRWRDFTKQKKPA